MHSTKFRCPGGRYVPLYIIALITVVWKTECVGYQMSGSLLSEWVDYYMSEYATK